MSAAVHTSFHADGTKWISGLETVSNTLPSTNGIPASIPNADGRNTVVALTGGILSDDGLEFTVHSTTNPSAPFEQDLGNTTAASLNATNSALYRIRTATASGKLLFLPATRFPFPWNPATNQPQFINPSNGVRTDVADNQWFIVFEYSFPDGVAGRSVKIITADTAFTTYQSALDYQWETLASGVDTIRDPEVRPLYKRIYYCNIANPNAYPVGCKYSALVATIDIRKTRVQATIAGGSGTVLASNVITTPTTSLVSTDAQSMFAEIDGRLLSGTTTEKNPPIDADSVGIWDSVASSFKRVTFANMATYVLGKLSFATQAEAEAGTNTTKYMNPLQSLNGFKYWIANTQFAPLTTTSKTVQGSINEINAKQLTGSTTEHTTPRDADSVGVWDSVGGVFKRMTLASIKAYIKNLLYASEILNDSTNKTGANVKLVIDGLVNHYQQATAPTIASTPALKKDDTWLDTTTLIKYAYTADSDNVLNWVNVNECGAEIPNVASGERVVTKSTTGVQVAKTLLDMQIAAGTIATANWSTGQATYTGQQGQTTYDANYKYECIGTNKWIRTALMEARLQLYLSPDIDDSLGAKTSAELDTAFPTAVIGQRVWGLLFLYEKKTTNIWKKISAVTA